MADLTVTDHPLRADEVADFLCELRALSSRLAAFEDVPADELAAFEVRKRALLDRIDSNGDGPRERV